MSNETPSCKKKKSPNRHLSLLIISRTFLKTVFIERIYLSLAQPLDRDGSQLRRDLKTFLDCQGELTVLNSSKC